MMKMSKTCVLLLALVLAASFLAVPSAAESTEASSPSQSGVRSFARRLLRGYFGPAMYGPGWGWGPSWGFGGGFGPWMQENYQVRASRMDTSNDRRFAMVASGDYKK